MKDNTEDDVSVYRLTAIGSIKNNTARRLGLVFTFPLLLCLNILTCVLYWPVHVCRMNKELFRSTGARWKNPRDYNKKPASEV